MKKSISIMLVLFIIIIAIFSMIMINAQNNERQIYQFNNLYEQYKDKIVLGSDIASLINKTIDTNEKNNIKKDENGHYINNKINSVRIFVKLEIEGEYYSMERINQYKISEFVRNFSLQDFKCVNIKYHEDTKLVSDVYFDIYEKTI